MIDPVNTAHLHILANLLAALQQLLLSVSAHQPLPPSLALTCRSWLLSRMRQLALHLQSTAAAGGLSRRVAMYDDMLYILVRDHDLSLYRSPDQNSAPILAALTQRVDEIRDLLLGFSPLSNTPLITPGEAACFSQLTAQAAGPMSVSGAVAGLVGWWTMLRGGWVELDLSPQGRHLNLNVACSPALVQTMASAGSDLRHLGLDIHIAWGGARGVITESGVPEVLLCDADCEIQFRGLMNAACFLTNSTVQDTDASRRS